MRKFDTKVQLLKYKALREVAREAWANSLTATMFDIPKRIIPGKTPTMRCCVYKERAIMAERVKVAMGWDATNPNVIEVIDIACDECPVSGYEITDACRGCLSHRCSEVCPRGAISFDRNQKARIDKSKCVDCGACAKVCPYGAIRNHKRPCENACRVKAIGRGPENSAVIDNDKCISCGACVYQCPFGAITDKSYILDVIDLIRRSRRGSAYRVYAIVAPAIASQFSYATLGQVVAGIRQLGFSGVYEAALGADMTALEEADELVRRGIMTSSCCPAFVAYIRKNFPDLAPLISKTPSPMAMIGRYIKEREPNAKTVFIGPCTAKKMEYRRDEVRPFIDSVITFEELQALFDSRDIELTELAEEPLPAGGSYYGRIFARGGGLTEAVREALEESGHGDFSLRAVQCDGIDACRVALLKLSKHLSDANFIEGMACGGGCIGGAGCLTHGDSNREGVERYGRDAAFSTIRDAVGTAGKED